MGYGSPASCDPPHGLPCYRFSYAFPAHSIFGVLENDAPFKQLRPYLVRSLEILRLPRLLPLVDQRLHFRVRDSPSLSRGRDYVEDGIETCEQRCSRYYVSGLEIARV